MSERTTPTFTGDTYNFCMASYGRSMAVGAAILAVISMSIVILFIRRPNETVDFSLLKIGAWTALAGAVLGWLVTFSCRKIPSVSKFAQRTGDRTAMETRKYFA